jgi:phage gp45-like
VEDYFTHRNSAHRFLINKIDDSGEIQLIDADGLADEKFTKIMRVYPHGFSSHAPKDSHMLGVGLGGRRDMLVALGGEHPQKRPRNIGEGNTAIYNADGTINKLIGKDWTLDAEGTMTVKVKKIVLKASHIVLQADKRIDLGKENAEFRVETEGGPSSKVYAVV